jgi:hypothetical protein
VWTIEHLVESDHVAFTTRSLYLSVSLNALDGKDFSQVPMSRPTSPIGARSSKLNRSSCAVGDDILLDRLNSGYMKSRVRSY